MAPRARRPRRNRRRRRRQNKVATIATVKRIVRAQEETKVLKLPLADISLGNRYVYAFQPFWQIAKGTGSNQRIGAMIRDVTLSGSFAYTFLGNDSVGSTRLATGGPLRIMVVRTPRDLPSKATAAAAWTAVTATAGTADDLPILVNPNFPATTLVDPNMDVKVVKQYWLQSSQQTTSLIAGNTVFKQFHIRIPRYEYDEYSGSGRLYNYYVLVVAQGSKDMPSNASIGTLQSEVMVRWKDA